MSKNKKEFNYTKLTKRVQTQSGNSKLANPIYKTLYEEKENEIIHNNVKKVHELFKLYDRAAINKREFLQKIKKEVGITPNEKFTHFINTASEDNKTFQEVALGLDLMNKYNTFSPSIAVTKDSRFTRYKKNHNTEGLKEKDSLQLCIKEYSQGQIDKVSFISALKKNNINPLAVEIDNVLRKNSDGKVCHSELAKVINRYRDSKYVLRDNTFFNDNKQKLSKKFGTDMSDIKFSVPSSSNQPIYLARRKVNNHKSESHSDYFNWDNNVKTEFEEHLYSDNKNIIEEKQKANHDKSKKNKSSISLAWNAQTVSIDLSNTKNSFKKDINNSFKNTIITRNNSGIDKGNSISVSDLSKLLSPKASKNSFGQSGILKSKITSVNHYYPFR